MFQRSIKEEIRHKIDSLEKVRKARIEASNRLYKYSSKWEAVLLIMNIIAVILLVLSFSNKDDLSYKKTQISAFYSLYTILIQYFYNIQNYRERALKFHYLELDIEQNIIELKKLLLINDDKEKLSEFEKEELVKEYDIVMKKYNTALYGYENHESIDFDKANNETKDDEKMKDDEKTKDDEKRCACITKINKKYKDFSIDNQLFYLNIIGTILIVLAYWKL